MYRFIHKQTKIVCFQNYKVYIIYTHIVKLDRASQVAQVKNLPDDPGDTDMIPESGRNPGGGHGSPHQ